VFNHQQPWNKKNCSMLCPHMLCFRSNVFSSKCSRSLSRQKNFDFCPSEIFSILDVSDILNCYFSTASLTLGLHSASLFLTYTSVLTTLLPKTAHMKKLHLQLAQCHFLSARSPLAFILLLWCRPVIGNGIVHISAVSICHFQLSITYTLLWLLVYPNQSIQPCVFL